MAEFCFSLACDTFGLVREKASVCVCGCAEVEHGVWGYQQLGNSTTSIVSGCFYKFIHLHELAKTHRAGTSTHTLPECVCVWPTIQPANQPLASSNAIRCKKTIKPYGMGNERNFLIEFFQSVVGWRRHRHRRRFFFLAWIKIDAQLQSLRFFVRRLCSEIKVINITLFVFFLASLLLKCHRHSSDRRKIKSVKKIAKLRFKCNA